MRTAKAKITKRVVDGAVPPTNGEGRIWDTDVKGFMLPCLSYGAEGLCDQMSRGAAATDLHDLRARLALVAGCSPQGRPNRDLPLRFSSRGI